jgi:single-strand selective monofunctional uracil DNA glycosylase
MRNDLIVIADELRNATRRLDFDPPVAHVYRPLDYAWEPHRRYLERYGVGSKEVVFVGMNPGPWGMAQTGVPFGEVSSVREWLGISGEVDRPADEHPKRPVTGFGCTRREVSGRRVWGWARDQFGSPERFFDSFFVANYCPLLFLEPSGRNLTPDKIAARRRVPMLQLCDHALRRSVEALEPRLVIGFGAFAEASARRALSGVNVAVARVLHPSPANPAANRGWARQVNQQLAELGVELG